jgi:hypothetical protein
MRAWGVTNPSDDEILSEKEAAAVMRCSLATFRRLNVPVAPIAARGTGKRTRLKLYLRSELFAYVRKHLTHSLLEPVAPRLLGDTDREREKKRRKG